MKFTPLDHDAVLDTIEAFIGTGPMQAPTSPRLPRRHHKYTGFSFKAMPEFERQLRQYEEEARKKYCDALEDMPDVHLPPWFARQLQTIIVPALERIGFDASLGWALFKMAAPAWKLMGPLTADNIWFNPVLIRDMQEIRKGVLTRAKHQSEIHSQLTEMDPHDRLRWIKTKMEPQKLSSLFETISTSWIILPRAYAHLEKIHAHYFAGYLHSLTKETHSGFAQILARLVIEFAGNYALKYISEILPRKAMTQAVFYGYATMFWKNLRQPPRGFEDALVHVNFLRWAETCCRRNAGSDEEMVRMIEKMKSRQEKTFPVVNAFDLTRGGHDDLSRFLITLRHGCPGTEAVVHYFGIDAGFLKNATTGRLGYAEVPAVLHGLFQNIRIYYPGETPGTQKFIRQFLSKLSQNYTAGRLRSAATDDAGPGQLRFMRSRVTDMIRGLTQSIQ
jgi:hypothetical protein